MEQEKLNEELNQLLKGAHMGASIFKDLREKLKSETLQGEFDEIMEKFRMHERSLTALVIANDGEAADSAGFMGTMADVMNKLKNLLITSDKEVLEEAVHDIDMAVKAVNAFEAKHYVLNDNLKKIIQIMKDDYSSIYHNLQRYLVEFRV